MATTHFNTKIFSDIMDLFKALQINPATAACIMAYLIGKIATMERWSQAEYDQYFVANYDQGAKDAQDQL